MNWDREDCKHQWGQWKTAYIWEASSRHLCRLCHVSRLCFSYSFLKVNPRGGDDSLLLFWLRNISTKKTEEKWFLQNLPKCLCHLINILRYLLSCALLNLSKCLYQSSHYRIMIIKDISKHDFLFYLERPRWKSKGFENEAWEKDRSAAARDSAKLHHEDMVLQKQKYVKVIVSALVTIALVIEWKLADDNNFLFFSNCVSSSFINFFPN